MLPASNSGVGMNIGFPDVCLTPVGPVPVPIPYPNMALNVMAVPFAPNVLVSFMPAINMAAEEPMTLGDQPGVASPFMGPGHYTMGNPVVLVNAVPAINLLCPTSGNNMINPIGAVLVPSVTNVFYTLRGGDDASASAPPVGPLDADAMERLGRAVSSARIRELDAAEGILALAVPLFTSGTAAQVNAALQRDGGEASALILDLRGCPGGELAAAVALAGDFLEEGAIVVTTTDGDGDETVHRAPRGVPHAVPLVILVDALTASAAEVFAGSLQAHGRAVLVGEATYGKRAAQQVLPGPRYADVATFALADITPDIASSRRAAFDVAVAYVTDSRSLNEVRPCKTR